MNLGKKDEHLLLKSGIPLEFTVGKVLIKNNGWTHSDHIYKRGEKEFSIDFTSRLINNHRKTLPRSIWLDILIECKYNNGPHKWIFFPIPGGHRNVNLKKSLSIILPFKKQVSIHDSNIAYIKSLNKLFQKVPIVWKGTDIFDNESNFLFICEGISQLKYAYISKLTEQLEFNFPPYLLEEREYGIILILVTNNPLYVVDKNIELSSFDTSGNIRLTKVNSLIYYSPLNSENSQHNIEYFKSAMKNIKETKKYRESGKKEEEIEKEILRDGELLLSTLDKEKVTDKPDMIWIMNNTYLDTFLKKISH